MPLPTRNDKAIAKLAAMLRKRNTTIEQIQTTFGVCERTAHRWIKYATEGGTPAARFRSGDVIYYRIVEP